MDASALMAVGLLADPTRQQLYLYIRERQEPVGREEAAQYIGVKPRIAAFHLDRMAEAGLLEVEYRRLSGRTGPGAGRPAKVYSISSRAFAVQIPQTQYALAASMMATALSGADSASGTDSANGTDRASGTDSADGADRARSLHDVATAVGTSLGDEIRHTARTKSARLEAARLRLTQLGYEPRVEESGEWTMRNCIFAELSASHREIVCPMNAAFLTGLLSGAHLTSLRVERRIAKPGCCAQVTGA